MVGGRVALVVTIKQSEKKLYSKLTDLESRWKADHPSEIKSSCVSFCQSRPPYNKERTGADTPVPRIHDSSRCVLSCGVQHTRIALQFSFYIKGGHLWK